MKKYMMLDDQLPLANTIPLNPETGEFWPERHEEIIYLTTKMLQYEGIDREIAEGQRAALIAETTIRTEPFMVELHPKLRPVHADPEGRVFSMHPSTWDKLPETVRDTFTLVENPNMKPKIILPFRPELN